MAHPDTDIRYIKGIGETRANALNKLGIRTLEDLLSYFPRRWDEPDAGAPHTGAGRGRIRLCAGHAGG